MKPYWSSVSPKCSTVGCPDAENTEMHAKRRKHIPHWSWGKEKPREFTNVGDRPYGCLTINHSTADCRQPLELSKRQDSILPSSLQGEHDLGFLKPSEL